MERLIVTVSDAALTAASDGVSGDVELCVVNKLEDARLCALLAALNAERVDGFPSGRLFLDSIEQALAVALVNNYAVRRPSPRISQGGLTPARLRKVVEMVHAELGGDLSLEEHGGRGELEHNPLLRDVPPVNGPEPAPVCAAPQHRACQGDVACRRESCAGCGGSLRLQKPAALCARLPYTVRSQSHRIPSGLCPPGASVGR